MATSRLLWVLALLLAGGGAAQAREAASPAACESAAARPAIADARHELDEDTANLQARLKLADAWSDAGCFTEAISVLQAGEATHPRDKSLQTRLQVAKSLVSEQGYFDNVDRASKDAKLSRAILRCTKLSELSSCEDAISLKPDDPAIFIDKGDTLAQLKRPGEAILAYRAALALAADATALNARMAATELQRRALLDACQSKSGPAALRACEAAWLPGAPDEASVDTRRGLLLQVDNQLSPALDAYMAAQRVKPGEKNAALAIVSLSDSTGRKDALTLAARGSAFMTLGQPADAIEPLRQALALAPDLTEPKIQLRAAERAKAAERLSAAAGTPAPPAKPPAGPVLVSSNKEAASRVYSNDAPVSRSN